MSAEGVVLSDQSLDDESATEAAFREAKKVGRFDRFVYVNATRDWTAEIVLFQGFDESGSIPDGFQASTGVTVGGTNVKPGTRQWTTLQKQVKVQATRVKCTAKCRRRDGKEQELKHTDKVKAPGKYWVVCGFGMRASSKKSTDGLELEVEFAETDVDDSL